MDPRSARRVTLLHGDGNDDGTDDGARTRRWRPGPVAPAAWERSAHDRRGQASAIHTSDATGGGAGRGAPAAGGVAGAAGRGGGAGSRFIRA